MTGPRTRPFVILSTQRSGSTWVMDTLNAHPEVVAYGELFLEGGDGTPPWGSQDLPFFETSLRGRSSSDGRLGRAYHELRYLNRVYAQRDGVRTAGFKLMYGQATAHPLVLAYLAARRVRVIHVVRRNLLDIVVSMNTAVARGLFHARPGDEVPRVRVEVNAGELVPRFRAHEAKVARARKAIGRARLPQLELVYEDLAADPTSEFERVFRFLGAHTHASRDARLVKLNTQPHAELIENYDRVCAVLEATPYAGFLR